MITSQTASDFLKEQFPLPIRSRFLPATEIAVEAASQLFDEREFFSGPLSRNIKGRIITYAVARQFSPGHTDCSLEVVIRPVNAFQYMVTEIRAEKCSLFIHRRSPSYLLPSSKYLREAVRNNNLIGNQMSMVFDDITPSIAEGVRCALLQYEVRFGKVSLCRIILPNERLTDILGQIDLRDEMAVYDTQSIEHKEKQIVALKEELRMYVNTGTK